ncbi:hypothetical protein [Nocardioides flavescens]|uniref:Uncharacterized protein n=1 Tax=Nocardioides flavescens TaxID=2691959 RepID=A0A6L7EY99_9ACTN|nr:hypothetical protein [Nocardioides flavescens]MXG88432.1 hypothetical protein [Nocardioides flavescens]
MVIVVLGVLGPAALLLAVQGRRRARIARNPFTQLEAAARVARRQMNDAVGQSWRNIVD